MKRGSLLIVGSGIQSISHLTAESEAAIRQSDIVLYCVADPCTEYWIRSNSVASLNLSLLYGRDKPRAQTYKEMKAVILDYARRGLQTCVLFYGHPGLFVTPTHEALASARAEGIPARMCAAVSTIDCIISDLGIDLAGHGLRVIGATDLVVRKRKLHGDEHLVLLQVGMLGNPGPTPTESLGHNLPLLLEHLLSVYPTEHKVVHYRAAQFAPCDPYVERVELAALNGVSFSPTSTLYLPPMPDGRVDAGLSGKLGLEAFPVSDSSRRLTNFNTPSDITPESLLRETQTWDPSTPLTKYLVDISLDMTRLEKLAHSGGSEEFSDAGLSPEDVSALISRQSDQIQKQIVGRILAESKQRSQQN